VLSNFVETVGAEDAGKLDELLRLIEQKKGEADRSAT